jgi:polar amino acid transport system permease protein
MISFDFVAVLQQWPLLAARRGLHGGADGVSAVLGVALGVACGWARLGPRRGCAA